MARRRSASGGSTQRRRTVGVAVKVLLDHDAGQVALDVKVLHKVDLFHHRARLVDGALVDENLLLPSHHAVLELNRVRLARVVELEAPRDLTLRALHTLANVGRLTEELSCRGRHRALEVEEVEVKEGGRVNVRGKEWVHAVANEEGEGSGGKEKHGPRSACVRLPRIDVDDTLTC